MIGTLRDIGHETILGEEPGDRIALIRLNHPKTLNALNLPVRHELTTVATELDNDPIPGPS